MILVIASENHVLVDRLRMKSHRAGRLRTASVRFGGDGFGGRERENVLPSLERFIGFGSAAGQESGYANGAFALGMLLLDLLGDGDRAQAIAVFPSLFGL